MSQVRCSLALSMRFRASAASIIQGKILVLRMEQVSYLDQSGLYALQDVITDIENLGIQVYMVGLSDCQVDCMKSIHIIPHILSEDCIFADFEAFKKAHP